MISIQSSFPCYAPKEWCFYLGQLLIFFYQPNWELGIQRNSASAVDCPFLSPLFLPRSYIQSEGAPLVCILDKQPSIFAVVGLALFSLHGCPGCLLAVCLPCLHAVRSLFYLLRVRFMYDVYVWQKCGATVKKKKKRIALLGFGLPFSRSLEHKNCCISPRNFPL